MIKLFVLSVITFLFTGCIGVFNKGGYYSRYDAPLVEDCQSEIKASDAIYRSTMKPYEIEGKWYYPIPAIKGETFIGKASWYGPDFHGKITSNGERYNMHKRTAAHKTLPINTYVRVTNLNNGLKTVVRINDRGPFVDGRIIDLSYQAAKEIGLIEKGVVPVKLEVVSCDENANRYAQKINNTKSFKNSSANTTKNRYFVQIASLYNKSNAIKLKSKYISIDKKYRSYLIAKNKKNVKVYKLLIGRFASKEEAKNFIRNRNFKNAFILKD
jgi:rare lipoprotein A